MIKFLRFLCAHLPGGRWIAERWCHPDESNPNAYLYNREMLGWLHKPALKRQLPLLYRLFGSYCGLAEYRKYIVFGETAFRLVGLLNRHLGLAHFARLDLGSQIIYLNLGDPRMLRVPPEFLRKENCTTALQPFLRKGDTFIDLGGNHGSFSVAASQLVGDMGRVVTVEAQPVLADLIRRSLTANRFAPFEVHEFACGDREGTVEFFVPEATSGSSGMFAAYSATSPHRTLQVPLKRFDQAISWASFPGHVFLKLDVEGGELAFLRGAQTMIRARQPHILMEMNPGTMRAAGVTPGQMLDFIVELGYSRFVKLDALDEPLALDRLRAAPEPNVIFLPQSTSDHAPPASA